jgi:hypothetical protein
MNLTDIQEQLETPFAPGDIDFLPKKIYKDKETGDDFCTGFPFADPRVYQDRLNDVAPGEWSSQAVITVAGNKVIALVTVTICSVTRTDTGEAFLLVVKGGKFTDTPEENTATEAWSQAFKRACSQFGLGRFLYSLDKQKLPYSTQWNRIDMRPQDLRNRVMEMYRNAGILTNPHATQSQVFEQKPVTTASRQPTPQHENDSQSSAQVERKMPALTLTALREAAEKYHVSDKLVQILAEISKRDQA